MHVYELNKAKQICMQTKLRQLNYMHSVSPRKTTHFHANSCKDQNLLQTLYEERNPPCQDQTISRHHSRLDKQRPWHAKTNQG